MKMTRLAVVVLALAAASNARAAGFAVTTHSARSTAMATSVVAGIDDASSTFYNPAGMLLIDKFDIQIGDTMIIPSFKVTPVGGTEATSKAVPVFPPHLYAAYKVADMFAVGVGFNEPFGLVLHWPDGWAGSPFATDSKLYNYLITPNIAFSLMDNRIRIGGGMQIVAANLELDRSGPIPGTPLSGVQKLKSDTNWGVGGDAGIQIDLLPKQKLTLGFDWRSGVRIDFTGRSELSGAGIPAPIIALGSQDLKTKVVLPNVINFGLSTKPSEKVWVEADATYWGWQSFRKIVITPNNPAIPSTTLVKDWGHSWSYHLGAEFAPTEDLRLRLGGEYDNTPSPKNTMTPDIPDANRVNIGAGLGYKWGKFTADLGYQAVIFLNFDATTPAFPARYSGMANLVGLTLGYGGWGMPRAEKHRAAPPAETYPTTTQPGVETQPVQPTPPTTEPTTPVQPTQPGMEPAQPPVEPTPAPTQPGM